MGGWVRVPICLEDATCHTGGTQGRPCFKTIVEGPESRERFLLLPRVVADAWYMGKMGQIPCLLLRRTMDCGVWKRTRCTRQLLSAELAVWWLLLLGSMAVRRGPFQLCPDTQLLGGPEKSFFVCGLPRRFPAERLFGNGSERHCTTIPCSLPGRRTAQAGSGRLLGVLLCPAPLKDFHVCRSPFFLHFAAFLKRVCSFPRREVKDEVSTGNLGA